jgi:pimeloyl-ACP methyl ester carboxylesterase
MATGSGSVLEFARRHPQRVSGLILACCRLGGEITYGKAFAPLFRLAYSADPLFRDFKRFRPTAYSRWGFLRDISPRRRRRRRSQQP